MVKLKKSLSVLLSLLMVLSVFSTAAVTVNAQPLTTDQEYYIGDTIDFGDGTWYVGFGDDTKACLSGTHRLLHPFNRLNYNYYGGPNYDPSDFLSCRIYGEDEIYELVNLEGSDFWFAIRVDTRRSQLSSGIKCVSGSGTEFDPYVFDFTYDGSTYKNIAVGEEYYLNDMILFNTDFETGTSEYILDVYVGDNSPNVCVPYYWTVGGFSTADSGVWGKFVTELIDPTGNSYSLMLSGNIEANLTPIGIRCISGNGSAQNAYKFEMIFEEDEIPASAYTVKPFEVGQEYYYGEYIDFGEYIPLYDNTGEIRCYGIYEIEEGRLHNQYPYYDFSDPSNTQINLNNPDEHRTSVGIRCISTEYYTGEYGYLDYSGCFEYIYENSVTPGGNYYSGDIINFGSGDVYVVFGEGNTGSPVLFSGSYKVSGSGTIVDGVHSFVYSGGKWRVDFVKGHTLTSAYFDGAESLVPVGVTCVSGSGTQLDPYVFELAIAKPIAIDTEYYFGDRIDFGRTTKYFLGEDQQNTSWDISGVRQVCVYADGSIGPTYETPEVITGYDAHDMNHACYNTVSGSFAICLAKEGEEYGYPREVDITGDGYKYVKGIKCVGGTGTTEHDPYIFELIYDNTYKRVDVGVEYYIGDTIADSIGHISDLYDNEPYSEFDNFPRFALNSNATVGEITVEGSGVWSKFKVDLGVDESSGYEYYLLLDGNTEAGLTPIGIRCVSGNGATEGYKFEIIYSETEVPDEEYVIKPFEVGQEYSFGEYIGFDEFDYFDFNSSTPYNSEVCFGIYEVEYDSSSRYISLTNPDGSKELFMAEEGRTPTGIRCISTDYVVDEYNYSYVDCFEIIYEQSEQPAPACPDVTVTGSGRLVSDPVLDETHGRYIATVQADLQNAAGDYFVYWVDGDNNIVGTYRTYQFYVIDDVTLTPVYVPESEYAAARESATVASRMVGMETGDGTVTLYGEHSVSGGNEITGHGIIVTTNAADKDALDVDNSENNFAARTTANTLTGVLEVTAAIGTNADTLWARTYIVDGSGEYHYGNVKEYALDGAGSDSVDEIVMLDSVELAVDQQAEAEETPEEPAAESTLTAILNMIIEIVMKIVSFVKSALAIVK